MAVNPTPNQRKDYEFFKVNLKEWLDNPILTNKYAVICNEKLVNAFDTLTFALLYAKENCVEGEYIVQKIEDESQIVNFVGAAL